MINERTNICQYLRSIGRYWNDIFDEIDTFYLYINRQREREKENRLNEQIIGLHLLDIAHNRLIAREFLLFNINDDWLIDLSLIVMMDTWDFSSSKKNLKHQVDITDIRSNVISIENWKSIDREVSNTFIKVN